MSQPLGDPPETIGTLVLSILARSRELLIRRKLGGYRVLVRARGGQYQVGEHRGPLTHLLLEAEAWAMAHGERREPE